MFERYTVTVKEGSTTSPKLTAEWEHRLKQIERGEYDADYFMRGIATFTKAIVTGNTKPKPECVSLFPRKYSR